MLIFQTWIKSLRHHRTKGFFEARDLSQHRHLLISSQTPSPIPDHSDSLLSALQQFDMAFAAKWYQISLHDPIWTAPPPSDHLPVQPNPRKHLLNTSDLTDAGQNHQRTLTGNYVLEQQHVEYAERNNNKQNIAYPIYFNQIEPVTKLV
jgi:hypothetical protein